jgi:poly(ribitol-phosphate) beta-N-acetylglucosaminyltransferase
MPYLTRCLMSLVRQSIGRSRLEVIAVDDGSTDGSGVVLDRFVGRFPDLFTVIHQPNSGGPAGPSNRGLRLATGRYVFFLGADDYLGRQALARLVTAADAYGADVVAGRMVGCNGRFVPQAIFARTDPDVDLYTSALPFAMSNTKLFRRSLLVEHHIRFPESLPFGSDQPFTVAACVAARKISVLADYDYYYAVRRHDDANITYRASHRQRLACTAAIMAATADLLPPGPRRDAILHRSFASELSKLTRPDFLTLDAATQTQITTGIATLANQYLTDPIAARLDVNRRLRLRLAQHHHHQHLLTLIGHNSTHQPPPLHLDHHPHGDRLYATYPGFGQPDFPDPWYLVTDSPTHTIAHHLTLTDLTWRRHHGRTTLTLTAHSPHPPATVTAADLHVTVATTEARITACPTGAGGTFVCAEIPLRDLLVGRPRWANTHDVLIHTVDPTRNRTPIPVRIAPCAIGHERLTLAGARPYVIRPTHRADGEVAVDIIPVTAHRIARRVWAILLGVRRRATSTTPDVHRRQVVEYQPAGHDENALQPARRPSA